MKFLFSALFMGAFFVSGAHGQIANFKNAGQCYGMVLASYNAGLIKTDDLTPATIAITKKYGPTYNRIASKLDQCTGKNDGLMESCIQKLGSKDDSDFMLGFFGAYGYIRAGKAQGMKGVALEYVAVACKGVS